MVWVLGIFLFICLVLLWLLVSPLVLEIDSRKPVVMLKWISIGKATIWYDEEGWFSFRVLFFHKTFRLAEIKSKPKKTGDREKAKTPRKRRNLSRMRKKMVRVLRTFRIEEWRAAIDTGDYSFNAQIYPLNFFPKLRDHLQINFSDENYLYVRMRNRPLKMLYAFLR